MALRFNKDMQNFIVNQAIVKKMAGTMGTGGTASLKIYTGSQPASADTAPTGTSGTLLCTISGIGWGGSNGTIGATAGFVAFGTAAGYLGTAVETGTAGWARMETVGTNYTGSAGTFRIDGDVGTASTGHTFMIDGVEITAAGVVTLLTCPISVA